MARLKFFLLKLSIALTVIISLMTLPAITALAQGPVMQSIEPLSNTHTAPLTAAVSITYDQPISAATVSTRTFAVQSMGTGLLTQTYSVQSGTIVLTPTKCTVKKKL